MNHVSFLEADILVSKKIIINFYLSYPLFRFFFSLFTFVSHCFIIFLPSTFLGTHMRTVRTGSYAHDFVKNNFSLSKAQYD